MRTRTTARPSDGTSLAVQVAGGGPPLLLLAGHANHHGWWDSVRPDFADRTTVTMDWRGAGESEEGPSDFSTRSLTVDVVAVLDALDVEILDFYGTSMGGRVAQWLAVDDPSRVGRLVLGCTTPGGRHVVERSQEVRRRLAVHDPRRPQDLCAERSPAPAGEHPARRIRRAPENLRTHPRAARDR